KSGEINSSVKFAGLEMLPFPLTQQEGQFDLKLDMEEVQGALCSTLQYSTDMFDVTTISRMLLHFQTLLENIVDNPEQPIYSLSILTVSERNQLLSEWNNTNYTYPQDHCLHQLIEEQAKRNADAIAVEYEDECISYRELNQRANQLGHYLHAHGVGPEVLVGVLMERSIAMIISLLGIMKTGGAYLPLDTTYPLERLAFILADTQVPILLTQENLLDRLPSHLGQVVCIDSEWDDIATQSIENVTSDVSAENLAYVIYTSGSTGKPKGTLVDHRGVVNYLHWCTQAYNLTIGCGAPVHSPLTFDLTITSLFAPLITGKKIVLLRESPGIEALIKALQTGENYSIVKLTPAHLQAINQVLPDQLLAISNGALIIGGEALSFETIAGWRCLSPQTKLFNEYGPTETVVGCSVYQISDVDQESGSVPIGRPIANTQLYLLDNYWQPVPVGVVGELYIGGVGLARGYLNRPDLTAEKFIPNPFSDLFGARLYKTGDLACYQADGNIKFLGRIDNQVKIHGFRVELTEIESTLSEHPAVREAVVLACESPVGGKQLVGYIVPAGDPSPSRNELQNFLSTKLPGYMVPTTFVVLDKLPLTTNGKVDRQVLTTRDWQSSTHPKTITTPRNSIEERLVNIWKQIFSIDQVDINANFFELGGDSILGIKMIAKANQAGLSLTLDQLFQHQTLSTLAAVAHQSTTIEHEQTLVVGSLPLTPIQHWFFEKQFPVPQHWNLSVLLQVQQPLIPKLLVKVVQQLLQHHDSLRLRFVQDGREWQQTNIDYDGMSPFIIMDLASISEIAQQHAIELVEAQLQASLDLSQGPLIRVLFFDLGPSKSSQLLIILHHLVTDGVSLRILLEDLQTGYEQLSRGAEIRLAQKTTAFKQWSERQWEYAQTQAVRQQLDYWLSISGKEIGSIPVDYPNGSNIEATTRTVSRTITKEETCALLQEVPKAYHTQINDVLLSTLSQTLAFWIDTSYLLIDLEGHGRESISIDVDLSRTVGWFTTIFPLLLHIDDISQPQNVLKSIKEQLRLVPNHGFAYGLLRYLTKDTAIADQLRALPQAEISFNYLGQFDQMLADSSLFILASNAGKASRNPTNPRPYLLEINGCIIGGRLKVDWVYSESVHRRTTIEALADNFLTNLRTLIKHCQSPEAGGYTPSDFPQAKLNQQELDKFIKKIANIRRSNGNS
ncbi:MAG: amino acid adenylation domain-containing protein, partial [Acidobacteriota bacterium]